MRYKKNLKYDLQCWFCDYGFLILAFILIVVLGIVFRLTSDNFLSNLEVGLDSPSIVVTMTATNEPAQTEQPENDLFQPYTATVFVETPATAQSTPTPLPQKPEFIIAFIPVHWEGDLEEFGEIAIAHFNHFVVESNIDDYFDVRHEIIFENLISTAWGEASLVLDIIEFGLLRTPADRYMGLTDMDLSLDGDYWIAGWTMGEDFLGAVGEASYLAITAHELGHTFGLCDEYSYEAWSFQNSISATGCPNNFPAECIPALDSCDPEPNTEGHYSIMGFAREESYQVFYQDSLDALRNKFDQMVRRRE
jgi:hypothetical protein